MGKKIYVVMSGGIDQGANPNKWVEDRINYVASRITSDEILIFSSSFTLNKLPVIREGKIQSEASSSYRYFREKYRWFPIEQLICENFSHDTIGSIYFSSLIAESIGASKIIFVTNNFHIKRVQYIIAFMKKFFQFEINCESVENSFNNQFFSQRDGEDESILLFNKTFLKCVSKEDVFMTLLMEHTNYNHVYSSTISKSNLSTY